MNNYERIKNMSLTEMAEGIKDIVETGFCTGVCLGQNCTHCIEHIKKWLKEESRIDSES